MHVFISTATTKGCSDMNQDDQDQAPYLAESGRRDLLIRGTRSLAALAAGGLVGARVAQAQPIAVRDGTPSVDRLSITVVTDSYHHAFERAISRGALTVSRTGFSVAPGKRPDRTLQNEWGLSLHVESSRRNEVRRVLLDFGYTPATLLNNLALLGIDPAKLDALALSHGHVDHFGGLAGFLAEFRGRLRERLPLYLGGEDCFCERDLVIPGNAGYFGAIDRQSIRDAGLVVTFAPAPSLVADHGVSTGRVELQSFERVLAPTRMTIALTDAQGCTPDDGGSRRAGDVVADDFGHEIAMAYQVGQRGLVVMTSCGHRGVVNSVRAAMKATGVDKLLAVLGGFHLAPSPHDYQLATAKALLDLNPEFVVPMHCSGEHFIRIVSDQMGERFVRSSTGSTFTFAA